MQRSVLWTAMTLEIASRPPFKRPAKIARGGSSRIIGRRPEWRGEE
jgi:hypothetical protein